MSWRIAPPPAGIVAGSLERPLRLRHTTMFHAMVMATFFGYGPVWWAVGYPAAAMVCALGGAAVGLNGARHLVTRAPWGHAQVGMGIATLGIVINSAMLWREFPILLAWTMFGPVFGWILGSPRQAIGWFLINIVLVAVAVSVVYPDDPATSPPELPERVALIMTAANAVSMGAVALVAIYMLTQNHEHYLAAVGAQQASLEHTNQRLGTAHRYKDRFFATVSHELRTPMNAVSGITELLHDRPGNDAETSLLLDTLRASSSQLLHVIDDLVDLTRAREHLLTLIATDFDLAEAGRAAVTKARAQHPPRAGVGLDVDLGPARMVRGDRQRLVQLMAHLIANAFKFTETGTVAVRLTSVDEGGQHTVRVVVRDTGVGIPPEAQPALFEADAQVEAHQTVRYGGVGLGLPLAQHLAELMGGGLTITSQPGAGTEVVAVVRLEPSGAEHTRPSSLTGRAPRILVVDDNRVNVLVTVRMLEKLVPNAILVTAADGAEAVARVREAPFELVLMDMQMPVLDGAGATRRIRDLAEPDRAGVPIVAITANAGTADLQACLDAGMDHALSKPVSMANLATVLERYLPAALPPPADQAAPPDRPRS